MFILYFTVRTKISILIRPSREDLAFFVAANFLITQVKVISSKNIV